jgi:hypothetical protein
MLRAYKFGVLLLLFGVLLQAATLQKMGLDEMAQKSTAIVRARVTGSYAAAHGSLIYTHYKVQVAERWKGDDAGTLDIVVPGGTAAGLRQSFPGAPRLAAGRDYVLFLWTGPSGLTHIMGLSQGLFDLKTDEKGELVASRAATGELIMDAAGRPVKDETVSLHLTELRARISRAVVSEGGRK